MLEVGEVLEYSMVCQGPHLYPVSPPDFLWTGYSTNMVPKGDPNNEHTIVPIPPTSKVSLIGYTLPGISH
jgi:hypothetical protein